MMWKKLLKYTIWSSMIVMGALALLFYRPKYLRRLLHSNGSAEKVLYHINTEDKVVALTIDDGPHADITPQLLDLLFFYNVPATFFLLGDNISGNEFLVKRMIAEGHELGNHMLDDQRSLFLTAEEFDRQITAAHTLLSRFGPVRWYRPGSGLYDRRMLNKANHLGYKVALASIYPYDAQIPGQIDATQFVSSYVVANATPGAIIVLHDGTEERARIVDVLTEVIPQLKADGYRFVTLSELALHGSD